MQLSSSLAPASPRQYGFLALGNSCRVVWGRGGAGKPRIEPRLDSKQKAATIRSTTLRAVSVR